MSSTNRVRVSSIREVTLGTTPASPKMKEATLTNVNLTSAPNFTESDRLRSDRMMDDPTMISVQSGGSVSDETSVPMPGSVSSDWYESAMFNTWSDALPFRSNEDTADSQITDVIAASDTFTVATGTAFAANMLVWAWGFTNAANNGLHKAIAGSNATSVVTSSTLTDEVAPPAMARLKAVGYEAGSGDIAAVADGITSTLLDFTTLGLSVGQWVKIGGIGAGFRFSTEANNSFARIAAIAAGKLTLDNLPSGWAVDAGTGKTLRLWFGDHMKNGTTMMGHTIERGYLGQAAPTYLVQKGMVVDQLEINVAAEQKVTEQFTFVGMNTNTPSLVTLDASPTPADSAPVLAAPDVCRIAENGATIVGPDFGMRMAITINNNLQAVNTLPVDCEVLGPSFIRDGSQSVRVSGEFVFGSKGFLDKVMAGTPTNFSIRLHKQNRALIVGLPRVTLTQGNPAASAKNQTQMFPFEGMATRDPATNSQITMDRFAYYQK